MLLLPMPFFWRRRSLKRDLTDKIYLKKGVIGSERWGDKMRKRIAAELGVQLYDIYGLTEVYGPGIAMSCDYECGMHYWDDYVYFEIVDPKTGEAAAGRRDRRAGDHHLAQTGRAPDPLPDSRPDPIYSRRAATAAPGSPGSTP